MGRPRKNPINYSTTKKVLTLPGAFDISAQQSELWELLIKKFLRYCRIYGFGFLETPFLEDSKLYENFYKLSERKSQEVISANLPTYLTGLRPQLLPSVLRAYYENKIYDKTALNKWSFSGYTAKKNLKDNLIFDYEYGCEVFGNFTHLTEAQMISAIWEFAISIGLKDITLEINSLGKPECQVAYQETLQNYLSTKKYQLCDSCIEYLPHRALNVFRCDNLDCLEQLSEAPTILDFLDEDSHKHFTNILEALDELGIPYQLNNLYAGPAGHSKTNFVIKYQIKGKTFILGEGGYHESLMQNLCGKNYCCFGFVGSMKILYENLSQIKNEIIKEQKNDVFLVPLGELASKKSLRLFRDLIREKVSVYDHFGTAGVKNQLKTAESFKAPIALIMGQKEAVDEMVILRDVKSGMQEVLSYDKIVEEVKKRLGR
jgi:histidyl-tRNA synthetase